jgi:hypothetical protein
MVRELRKRMPPRVDEEDKSMLEFAEYMCSLNPNNVQSMIHSFQKSSLPMPVKAFIYRQLFYLSHYFLNHVLWGKSLENFDIFSCLSNHFLAPPGHLFKPPSPYLDDEKWTNEIWLHYNRFKDLVNENADINTSASSSSSSSNEALSQQDFFVNGGLSQLTQSVNFLCHESFLTQPPTDFSDIDFESLFKSPQ